MDSKVLQLAGKDLRFDREFLSLIKPLVFIYALKKADVSYPLFLEGMSKPTVYLETLYQFVEESLGAIEKACGKKLTDIVKQCLDNYEVICEQYSDMGGILTQFNSFTPEHIEAFFTSGCFASTDRYTEASPATLNELIIKLLSNGKQQKWLDMGCGFGSFLVQLAKTVPGVECYGIDVNANCAIISQILLYFTNANYHIKQDNVLFSKFDEFVDVAYGNLPFLTRLSKNSDEYNNCNKYVGDLRAIQNADWMFADRLIQATKDRCVIVLSEASLMNNIDAEQRKNVVEKNLIEGVIKLPSSLFMNFSIPVTLVIFNKHKKTDKIKFMDATEMRKVGRRLSELKVDEIVNAYQNDQGTVLVGIDTVAQNDYSLQVKKYIDMNKLVLKNETVLETLVDEIFRGAQIPASVIDENSNIAKGEQTYKLISVGDIQNGTFEIGELQTIKDNGKYERYLLREGDVLLSAKGTKIKTAVVDDLQNQKIVATGSILVIRCNGEKLNPAYLKAFFDSRNGAILLNSIQTGTLIISINASAIAKMKISLLDKTAQDKIADNYNATLRAYRETKTTLARLERSLTSVFDDYTE